MAAASLAELRDVAIEREPDRYFAATLAPAALRYDLVALAAFAAEIARIPEQVREPLAGEIRLQWWRDALAESGSDTAAGHPVAGAMRSAMDRIALPYALVEGVIDVQTDIVHGERPADEAALRAHLVAGEGSLFRLAAQVCTGEGTDDDAQTAEIAGVAYGLARLLVRIPADRGAALLLPRSLVGDDEEPAEQAAAVVALAAMARKAHADVVARLRKMPRRRRLAFLPLAMVRPNLRALEGQRNQRDARPFEPLPIGRLMRIGWAHASGRL